jgi:hypothetical protein
MTRSRTVVALGALLGLGLLPLFAQPEARQDKLKERDRLAAEAVKLHDQGKVAEAVALWQKKLTIERDVLGQFHEDTIASLKWLAEQHSLGPRAIALLIAQIARTGEHCIEGDPFRSFIGRPVSTTALR